MRRSPIDSLVRVYCPSYTRLRVSSVVFVGNEVTKERILRAELDFREGDTLAAAALPARLEANRRRLLNLQLFHSVLVQTVCRDGEITVLFSLQERWYTFPIPIFSLADRNIRSWLDRPDRWRRVDYGVHVVRNNFRGRNEQLRGNLQLGFNQKYEVFFENPGTRQRPGLALGASFARSRALDYRTVQDQLLTYRSESGFAFHHTYFVAGLRWRNTVQRRTALDVAWRQDQISDSIQIGNPGYFSGDQQRRYVDVALTRIINRRNNFAYPLSGRFAQVTLSQRLFLHSASPSYATLYARYTRYVPLPHKLYYSAGLEGQTRLTNRRLAYADSRALGYAALVRGYDRYVVDGQHYVLLQQGLSYPLLPARQLQLDATSNPKFSTLPLAIYLNTFADMGYVAAPASLADANNQLPNQFLLAAGIGLHLVTYYDRVFAVEYALNALGETGIYIRTAFPI
ncbi:BamA/TamA family outer membrane protein [Hymenobacter sp. DG25A]|uniref:BamA/TamA family outer membrane protein n=1 Tax=Hymenobacter sp. DG25A TaxID=1385663 RepID=UPI0006C87AD6|nr:BamA/TamA family outer membrane protein [Hymenobacter sp. DG25A]